MTAERPEILLQDVEQLRQRTRSHLHAIWFPLVVFGGLSMLSAAVAWRFGGAALGVFWLGAAPAGSLITGAFYRRRERRIGLEAPPAPYVIAAAGIILGAFVTGGVGGAFGAASVSAIGPPLCVSAGYLVFARLARSPGLAVVAAALAALDLTLAAARMQPNRAAWVLALAYGVVFVLTGLTYRAPRAGR